MNLNSDFMVKQLRNKPVIPLPNPGEGGSVGENGNNNNGSMGNRPVAPLPNPGEGGSVGGNGSNNNRPIIPLPNPGEGGPVGGNGSNNNRPIIPLPNPGEGGPVGGPTGGMPVIPLPNPGEGGPVSPGNRPIPPIISTIISVHPRPNIPCNFCVSPNGANGMVRFLNAASDYNPFMIYVNDSLFAKSLSYSELTEYERVSSGMQTISILGEDGYIYIQKQVNIPQNGMITIAIVNSETGLDLTVISDAPCNKPYYLSCIRACNLSYNSGPLNVVIGDQYITFSNVNYKEVTEYMSIWAGVYGYYVGKANPFTPFQSQSILLSSTINVKTNAMYTIYLFNWNKSSSEAIRALVVEEQR